MFEPMGLDAFGMHSENHSLKVGTHPANLIPAERRELQAATGPDRRDVRLVARGSAPPMRAITAGRSGSSCNC